MKRVLLLGFTVLAMLVAPATGKPPQTGEPLILSAVPDLEADFLVISGDGLHGYLDQRKVGSRRKGTPDLVPLAPSVTLGGLVLPIVSFNTAQIYAQLPSLPYTAGTYLLTVAHDSNAESFATFQVTMPSAGNAALGASKASAKSSAEIALVSEGGGGGEIPLGVSLRTVLARIETKITDIDTKVNELVAAGNETVSKQICIKHPIELGLSAPKLAWEGETVLMGKIGVDAYGNGLTIITAPADLGTAIELALDTKVGVEWSICWDKWLPGAAPEGENDLLAGLTEFLVDMGVFDPATVDVNEANLLAQLEAVSSFDPSLNPLQLLSPDNNVFAEFGQLLPLPSHLKDKLVDIRSTIDSIASETKDQLLGICDSTDDFPPALGNLISEMCDKIPEVDIEQIQMVFDQLLQLRPDIATCFQSSQIPFTIPQIASPAIKKQTIHIPFPIDQTFTTFPAFPAQVLFAGKTAEVIRIETLLNCLKELLP